ncbi:MAG: HEAT repeat domain-containing protein [Acidobacteriota bacterium]|nr:HEAT repeat domain-containing protein [Acidobacteriota bacterium]
MDLAAIDSNLEQIDELVRCAADADGMLFRMRLEELVKKGGRSTENAIALYITGKAIDVATRLNLVRLAGYIRSDAFLLPLQQVIEAGDDELLREEAIISISKYNDRRALDILARALDARLPRALQDAVVQGISRIRSNNPLLAMLPRFLKGGQNREMYEITLKIFKKILGPDEAKNFIAYLHHGDPLVAAGSFEILCFRGGESMFFFIAEFFRENSRLLARGMDRQVGAARLQKLIVAMHEYLRRYPEFFAQLRPDIASLRQQVGDAPLGKDLDLLLAMKVPGEENDPQRDGGRL